MKFATILALILETHAWVPSFIKSRITSNINIDHGFGHSLNRDSKMILG